VKDNDIEVLDFDDEVIYTEKKVVESKKIFVSNGLSERRLKRIAATEVKSVKVDKKSDKKSDKKGKYGIGEKIFLSVSILFIIGCFIFYGYRTYHFYHLTHDIVKNITLKEKLTSLNNIAFQNDGLYEKSGYYYYKGLDVNNYVYYSGRLFRIIDIDKNIRMIEDSTETNLVWTFESNYSNSYIQQWLKNYLETLKDYDVYLDKSEWCNDAIDLNDYNCSTVINDYVGLLSTNDYLQAGGKNSYLNNETYFWTINQDLDGNVYYINNEGNINNLSKKEENYYSYGIRPVITLKADIGIISGDGSKNSPFIIEDLGNALLKDNSIGSFVEYYDDTYRIIGIDDKGVSLIYDDVLEVEKSYNDVYKYLNNEFIKKYNKTDLVKNDYYINEYSYNNKYIRANSNKKSNYITIPSIGDLFLNSSNGYWLNDFSNSKLGLYYILDENEMLFSDLSSSKHYIKPIIKLNLEMVVSSGTGMEADPLIVGEEGEGNVEKN